MKEAKVYAIQEGPYSHMVKFVRRGHPTYKRRHRTEQAAKEDAREFNERLLIEGSGTLHIGAKEREELAQVMRMLEGSGISLRKAVEMALAQSRQSGSGRCAQQMLTDYMDYKETLGRSNNTIRGIRSRLKMFLENAGVSRVGQISAEKVRAWVKPGTNGRNNYAVLSAWCAWMIEQGYLDRNPCSKVARPARTSVEDVRTLTAGESAALMAFVEKDYPDCAAFYAVLLFGFLRPSEASELRETDLLSGRIRVIGGKMRGRKRRFVPILPALSAFLDKYQWNVPPESLQKKIRGKSPVDWSEDICRHTGISFRLADVQDENQVAREAGNSPDVIFRYYHSPKGGEETAQFWAIRPECGQ